jgi:hypothetical protein
VSTPRGGEQGGVQAQTAHGRAAAVAHGHRARAVTRGRRCRVAHMGVRGREREREKGASDGGRQVGPRHSGGQRRFNPLKKKSKFD